MKEKCKNLINIFKKHRNPQILQFMYTNVQKWAVRLKMFCLKEINTFIHHLHIKLLKSDFSFATFLSFKLSVYQRNVSCESDH